MSNFLQSNCKNLFIKQFQHVQAKQKSSAERLLLSPSTSPMNTKAIVVLGGIFVFQL